MPKARDLTEVYAPSPWFAIGEKDVFPEEFRHFMMGHADMIEVFERLHADLFTAQFWQHMQKLQKRESSYMPSPTGGKGDFEKFP